MAIELGGIKLNRVHRLVTLEQANLISHRVPGMAGNLVQDLGRDSVFLGISGIFYGSQASKDLEQLRQIYKQRKPVDFIAEIVGRSYFGQVIVERFEVFQLAREPEQFSYTLTIAEYTDPPSSQGGAAVAKVDKSIQVKAKNLMDVATLPDALQLGTIPEITNPFQPLKGALEPVQEATKDLDKVTEGLKAIFGI
ncbi:DNA circularization N-terminal domain-containing protein [Moorena sp. SIO4G3]|uniref:DNA circularization N-terminal domain-containing protein n=1 Tax=Moorena sp. SIO4G3 TaxID=2607821 RepID=UPI00142BC601|nr:DNA circularization N-terminal domain-containing protein [Moorena sp. SIO4G3]NEO76264.1 hypothetical protein [Moorena sp. SIO4G3]